jgi:hypothetical protein
MMVPNGPRGVGRSGGRRWVPMFWVEGESVGEGLDRLHDLGPSARVFERDYEYRMVWDPERGMWRLDRRRTAAPAKS